MDEEDLRRALKAAAPDAPDPSSWPGAARRRSAVRKGVVAALSVCAVAAALVVVNLPGRIGDGVPATPASVAPTGGAAAEEFCYQDADAADTPRKLETGAVAVQLCPDADNPDHTYLTPTDRLTQGVDALVTQFDTAAPTPLDQACEDEATSTFLVVFVYPDGSRIPLRARAAPQSDDVLARPGACDRIDGPDGWRDGSVLTALRAAWLAQRENVDPTAFSVTTCQPADRPSLFAVDLETIAAGVLCLGRESVVLDVGQARELATDIRTRSREEPNDDQNPTAELTLYTAWSEPLTMVREGDTTRWAGPSGNWHPSTEVRQWLDPMLADLAASGATPEAGSPCAASGTTDGDIPAEAVSLRLCPSGEDDLQQLTPTDTLDSAGARDVLAVLRAQPTVDTSQGCDADLGPSFFLIAESFGRGPVVLELQLAGCRTAGTTTDQRSGAQAVLDAFRSALVRQREREGPANPGATCQGDQMRTSVMPVALDDVTAGVACSFPGEDMMAQRWPDDAGLAAITADITAQSDPRAADDCPSAANMRLPETVVLVNEWGDRLVLSTAPCPDSYTYRTDAGQFRWRPSASVVRILEALYG